MSGTTDPWAEFRVQAQPADPWAEFRATPAAEQPAQPSFGRRVLDTAVNAAQGLRNFTRAAQGGQLLGFRDEAQAAATALLGGGSYAENLAAERQAARQYEQQNPVASGVATAIGGFTSPAMAIPVGRAGTMTGNILRGGAVGAATGGVSGFGEGEGDAGSQALSAARGALIGGTLGAALPPVIQGGAALGARAGQFFGVIPPDTAARRLINRDLARDGVDPNDLLRRAQQPGKPEMLADLGGENVLQSAQVVARSPGAGRQIAAQNLAGRTGAAQSQRLNEGVQSFSSLDYRQEMPALLQQRSTEARPLYERAWNLRVPNTVAQNLEPLTNSPIGQQALGRGLRLMEEEGRMAYAASVREGQPNPSLLFDPETVGAVRGQNGEWTLQGRMQNLRLFDAVKRGFDEIVYDPSSGARDPVTGRLTQFGRAIEGQRENMVGYLRDHPNLRVYGEALDAWAGPSALMDAMRTGRTLLSDGAEAAERTATDIARMSPSEREFFRVGVKRGLMDRIESTVDSAEQTRLNRIFMSDGVRSRLRAAFDNDAEFKAFADNMMREANITRTNRTIAPNGGSPTMPMTEKAADLRQPPLGPVAQTMIDPERVPRVPFLTEWGQAGGTAATFLPVMRRRFLRGLEESAYRRNSEAMAPMLFSTDPAQREMYARGLLQQALGDEELQRRLGPVVQGLLRGAPAGAGLLAN